MLKLSLTTLHYLIGRIRISTMKKPLIIALGVVVLVGAAGVGAAVWAQAQKSQQIDLYNRIDYRLSGDARISEYLKEDVGLTVEELAETEPAKTGLNSFPELYLVARSMMMIGDTGSSLNYYQAAEKKLDGYGKKDQVVLDFYLSYIEAQSYLDATKVGQIVERATGAVDSSNSLSNEKKEQYKDFIGASQPGEVAQE